MNPKLKRTFLRALPLALLTFCLVTIKITEDCVGEPDLVSLGFPVAWVRPALFTSLGQVFDPLALALDFGVYLGVWMLLARTALFERILSWRSRLPSACLWTVAVVVTSLCALALSLFGYVGDVGFGRGIGCSGAVHRSLHVGLPFADPPS